MLGFVQFIPLAVEGIDFVYVIGALAAALVIIAGDTIYGVVFSVFRNISIFGVHPFRGLANAVENAMRAALQPLLRLMAPFGHFLWSLVMMVWRPLYVIVVTLQYLVGQITGVNQAARRAEAQLAAKENADIRRLTNSIITDVNNLKAIINADVASLTRSIVTDVTNLKGIINADVAALNRTITQTVGNATAQERADFNYLNGAIRTDATNLQANINRAFTTVNATITRDVTDLTRADATNLQAAKTFALSAITSAAPSIVNRAVTQLEPTVSRVATEVDRCLAPLCDTVTPNAKRLGHLGDLLHNLELLGLEALFIALAAECLTNPQGVVDDVTSVVDAVGAPILNGFRDLIGA